MSHTEEFNAIMKRTTPARKEKSAPVQVQTIGARDNMNELQTDLAKCIISGNVISLPFERLQNYDQVRRALLNAGAMYKRNTFIFPNDAQPYIDRLMGGESVNIKKEFQFFATPDKLADELVRLAEISVGHDVLEPSAGQGAIIEAVHRVDAICVDYCEIMDVNCEVLAKKVVDGMNANCVGYDFLKFNVPVKWDRIVANPPFSKNQDIDHIRQMYHYLKAGGRIVTIASKHWQQSKNRKETEFKNWLKEVNAEIQEIPRGAFEESGTMISSVIIIIDKIS